MTIAVNVLYHRSQERKATHNAPTVRGWWWLFGCSLVSLQPLRLLLDAVAIFCALVSEGYA